MRKFILPELPLIILMLPVYGCKDHEAAQRQEILNSAIAIHENVITIDTHVDIDPGNFTDSLNYTHSLDAQVDLPKMERGGLDAAWLIVFTAQDTLSPEGYALAARTADEKFTAIRRLCEEIAPERIALALSSDDIRNIHRSGKKVAMIGVENAYPAGEDLGNFRKFHDLGARYISLSHNGHSQFCDSNTGEADNDWLHQGLSELGKSAVDELNRLGIIIDISHVSSESMMQITQRSAAPVMASHSSARALCDHSRNLDDEQLLLLKEHGGLVQTVAYSGYLNRDKDKAHREYMKALYEQIADSLGIRWYDTDALDAFQAEEFLEKHPRVLAIARQKMAEDRHAPPAVDVDDFLDHIDYMVNLIGIDHVGISSDFDGGGGIRGWNDASETFNVTLGLVERGYTRQEIEKLWGGNLMRVLDEVQEFSATLSE